MVRSAHVVNSIVCLWTIIAFLICTLSTSRRPYLALCGCTYAVLGSIVSACNVRALRLLFAQSALLASAQTLLMTFRSSSVLIPMGPSETSEPVVLTGWYVMKLASLAHALFGAIYALPLFLHTARCTVGLALGSRCLRRW